MKVLFPMITTLPIFLIAGGMAGGSVIWNGPTLHFEKADGADGTLPANQDQLTNNVILARGGSQGLYNAATEPGFSHFVSPAGTEWGNGTTSNINSITFTDWNTWFKITNGGPSGAVGQHAVVHLVSDDIYLDLSLTSWSSGGGGFAYDRSTPAAAGPAAWRTAADGNWSVGANWTTGTAPNGAGQTAVLNRTTTATVTVTLDSVQTVGTLQFGNSGGNLAMGYTLSGANTLTLDNSGGTAQVAVSEGKHAISAPVNLSDNLEVSPAAGSTLAIRGNISQNRSGLSVTLDAPGNLVLSGSNNFGGGTRARTGKLFLENSSAIADGTSLTVDAGAAIVFQPASSSAPGAVTPSPVPEPSTAVLLGVGIIGLLGRRIRTGKLRFRTASATLLIPRLFAGIRIGRRSVARGNRASLCDRPRSSEPR